LLDEAELAKVRDALAAVRSCWPEPKGAQMWAVVVATLGRDPRDD
jgi:hypothetical protein